MPPGEHPNISLPWLVKMTSPRDGAKVEHDKATWTKQLEEKQVHRSDMNKLIMNYLVTEGFREAAEKFQVESGLSPHICLHAMEDRIKIREAVQDGKIDEAIRLTNQLHPELLDNDRTLFFHLQQLQLIELIRRGNVEEALVFAQCRLSEAGELDKSVLNELERTLALLAFEQPEQSPFNDLLNQSHRQKVASELNAAILRMENSDAPMPKLLNLVKLLLWSQDELDRNNIRFPHMVDITGAVVEQTKDTPSEEHIKALMAKHSGSS